MKKPPAKRLPAKTSCTVRPHPEDFARLRELKGVIAQRGWGAVGSTRTDTPTLAAVVGAALVVLEARLRTP